MTKLLTLSSLVLSVTMLLAGAAFAQSAPAVDEDEVTEPGELIISTGGPYRRPRADEIAPLADTTSGPVEQITEEELTHYLSRLPTLADLSKERWNEVHRRYDSRRGRREKLRA